MPSLLIGEHFSKRRHRAFSLRDLPEQFPVALVPDRRVGEIGRPDLQVRRAGTVSFARSAVTGLALLLVDGLSRGERFRIGCDRIGDAYGALWDAPLFV